VERLSAPSVRTISSTSCCQSRTARSALRRRSREARPRSSVRRRRAAPGRRERLPRRLGPLGGGLGVLEDQRLEAGLDGDGDPLGLLRLALDRVDQAVAEPADLGLQALEQLAGADELLPAGQHLAAQQGAVGGRVEIARARGRRPRSASSRSRRPPATCSATASATWWVRRVSGADRALEGLLDDGAAGLGVGGERVQPARMSATVGRREQAVVVDLALADDEQRGVLEAAAGEHPGEVGRDGLDGVSSGCGRARSRRRRSARRPGEEVPRHLVGVPGGAR
jgi:hypothetical protein